MNQRLTRLANGIRILTVPKTEALSVSMMVLVNAGAKDEQELNSGISHFLEHMAFKGTEKRPRLIDLSSELDALGASYNAFTCHDSTAYHITVTAEKIEPALELLSDLFLHPVYPAEEIEKEKGVIIEEIKLYEDQPQYFVWDVFSQLAYADTVAGRPVIGRRETVRAITREDLIKYRQQNYSAETITIIITGNFPEEEIIEMVSDKFKSLPLGEKKVYSPVAVDQSKPGVKLFNRPIEQSHLVLGFRSADLFDEKIYSLIVLAGILGRGMSSRLWQKIREELGLAYYVGANQNSHLDHGFLAIYSGVDARRLSLALKTISQEIKKLKLEDVPSKELERIKDYLIGNLFLNLEAPADQTYFYGEQALVRQEIFSPQQYAEKIRQVTAENLQSLAEEIFRPERLNLAVVGPDCSKEEIEEQLEII